MVLSLMRTGDPDVCRRARIILGFTLVLVVLGLETAAFFTWALPGRVGDLVSATLAVALALTLFIPTAFRRRGSVDLAAFLLNAAGIQNQVAAHSITTALLLIIGGIGIWRGFGHDRSLECWPLGLQCQSATRRHLGITQRFIIDRLQGHPDSLPDHYVPSWRTSHFTPIFRRQRLQSSHVAHSNEKTRT